MINRRGFLKFIASAVVAKSLLDNVVVNAIESAGRVSRQVIKTVSSAGMQLGDMITISGVNAPGGLLRHFRVMHINNGTDLVISPLGIT